VTPGAGFGRARGTSVPVAEVVTSVVVAGGVVTDVVIVKRCGWASIQVEILDFSVTFLDAEK
jgi:hypothetical protein